MRNLTDALMYRGTRPAADREATKLKAAAHRMGYEVVVRPTQRRYGTRVYSEPPFGLFLEPRRAQSGT
jgi:hypothetical protein